MLKDLQESSVGDLTETENEDDDELPKRTKRNPENNFEKGWTHPTDSIKEGIKYNQ